MSVSVTFRPITDGDLELLYRIYASTREEELSVVPWSDAEKEAFLQQQFHAQHTYYQQQYPAASYQVILLDNQPIGRLYLDRREDEHRIIDIALLTEYRGRGIGGALMQDILDEAATEDKPVRIHVECNNPALHLYHRLGFREIEDQGVYLLMEWKADEPAGD